MTVGTFLVSDKVNFDLKCTSKKKNNMITIIIKKIMKNWVSKYRNVLNVINKYEPTFEMF